MTWAEARRLSDAMYTEVAFQSIYGLRSGNSLSERTPPSATLALRRVAQSKLLISALLALVALGVPTLLAGTVEHIAAPFLPVGLYRTSVISALLVLDLALIWWTGLQVLPALLGSRVQSLVESLPVDGPTLERAALLTTLRLFDAPVVTILLVTPIVVGVSFGSALAGLAVLPGALAVVVVALALSVRTGHFYVQRIIGSHGGRRETALRWLYLVLWTLPAFALFGFITFSPSFFALVEVLYLTPHLAPELLALFAVFPFPLAALPSLVPGQVPPELPVPPLLLFSAAYVLVLAPVVRWLTIAPRTYARAVGTDPTQGPVATDTTIRASSPSGAILRKDLQVASRTPGFAFLLLLPLLDAVSIGVFSFLGRPTATDVLNVGVAAVGSAALLTTFFAPAFFAIEVFGFSYTRSLPIPRDQMLAAKVGLVLMIYGGATLLVLGLSAAAIPTVYVVNSFVFFALAELPAILAASLIELAILFRRAGRAGLPITSLYAGAGWVVAVSVPGLFIAGAPLVTLEYLRHAGASGPALLPLMAAMSLIELALLSPVAILTLGKGSL